MTRESNGVKYILKHGERTISVTAEAIAISIYTKLFEIASSSAQIDSDLKVVLCCPMNFPLSTRSMMVDAAEEAGFEVLQVISEPAATALAYSIGVQNPDEKMVFLVYRVGGATLDISVVDERSGMYSIEHTTYTSQLGGDRFTDILVQYLAEEYRKKCKLDPTESRRSMAKLRTAAEMCKHVLSTRETAHCFVESLCEGVDFSYNITRARFESLMHPIIQQYIDPIDVILQQAKMTNTSIQKVLLSGGTSKVPKLQQAIKQMFPHAEFVNSLSPDEVIAIGAARHASYLAGISVDPESRNLAEEIPAVSNPICFRYSGQKELQSIVTELTPIPVRKLVKITVEPAEEVTLEILENQESMLGILGKLSLGAVPATVIMSLEVCVNSVGGLSAVVTDNCGVKRASLKVDPPLEL